MKSKEFHRLIKANGWTLYRVTGSHYFYEKDGVISEAVPYHGSKEMFEPLRKKIAKSMGLK